FPAEVPVAHLYQQPSRIVPVWQGRDILARVRAGGTNHAARACHAHIAPLVRGADGAARRPYHRANLFVLSKRWTNEPSFSTEVRHSGWIPLRLQPAALLPVLVCPFESGVWSPGLSRLRRRAGPVGRAMVAQYGLGGEAAARFVRPEDREKYQVVPDPGHRDPCGLRPKIFTASMHETAGRIGKRKSKAKPGPRPWWRTARFTSARAAGPSTCSPRARRRSSSAPSNSVTASAPPRRRPTASFTLP